MLDQSQLCVMGPYNETVGLCALSLMFRFWHMGMWLYTHAQASHFSSYSYNQTFFFYHKINLLKDSKIHHSSLLAFVSWVDKGFSADFGQGFVNQVNTRIATHFQNWKYYVSKIHITATLKNLNKNYEPFLWMGFNCLKAAEPLWGDSLLFTT